MMLKWEDNIKVYLEETGWGELDWIDLAQDRDSNQHRNEFWRPIKFVEFFDDRRVAF
jgi:hypothetical protein